MTRRRLLTSVFGALWLTSHASGGEATAGAQPPPGIDACALLSAPEISKTVRLPVEAGKRNDSGLESNGAYSSSCVWVIKVAKAAAPDPTKPLGGRSFVILNAMQWPAGSGLAHTFLDSFREAAAHGEIPSQPQARKFGDEALSWGDGLAVRRRDVSFGVSVFGPGMSKEHRGAVQEQLAPFILRRLDARK
jgi:hypothetical protein